MNYIINVIKKIIIMTGKNIIQKELGNCFWSGDMKFKNARGKKTSWTKAEAKSASRKFRHNNNWKSEI